MSVAPRAVPLHSPAARHAADAPAREAAVLRALRSGRYVGGPERDAFEAALAEAMGWPFAVGLSSGTEALSLALMAAGLRPGDEVLVPAVSFFATAGAVLRLGCRPVLVDVRADLPLIDEQDAILALGPKVRAALPVHLFGLDAGALPALRAAAPDLLVIDDLAQAAGSGPGLGAGRLGALSFYPTKVLGGPGDGGAVLCRDIDDQQRLVRLGHHGRGPSGAHEAVEGWVGGNARLGELAAALLRVELESLPARVAARQRRARRIVGALSGRLRFVLPPGGPRGNVAVLCLRHPRRDALMARLAARGVGAAPYYPRSLGAEPALQGRARLRPCPEAEAFCAEALAVPCREDMTEDDVTHVIASLIDATSALPEGGR